jgi:hypothetical protein
MQVKLYKPKEVLLDKAVQWTLSEDVEFTGFEDPDFNPTIFLNHGKWYLRNTQNYGDVDRLVVGDYIVYTPTLGYEVMAKEIFEKTYEVA